MTYQQTAKRELAEPLQQAANLYYNLEIMKLKASDVTRKAYYEHDKKEKNA